MAAYCARADLEKKVGVERVAALGDHDNDGAETPAAVDNACDAATQVMDGWLSAVLDTPLDVTDYPALTEHAASIALWKLAVGKGADPDGEEAGLKTEHDEAMRWVKAVGEGRLRLNKVSQAAPGAVQVRSRRQIFTETELDKF